MTFHQSNEGNNYRTGKKSISKDVWQFNHVIVLPSVQSTKFVYDLSFIASNKNFTMGGFFDTSKRKLILDAKDATIEDYEPQQRHYFTLDGKRWEVTEVHKFEFNTGWLIVGTEVTGAPVREVHMEKARNRAIFSDSASVEVL